MATAGIAYIELRAKLDQFQRDLKTAGAQTVQASRGLGTRMQSVGDTITRRLALPMLAVGAIAANELKNVEAANAQTAAALESTGGAANVTAAHITDLATRMQELAAVDAEEVQAAENVLLTFTKVRNEVGKGNAVFDRATMSIANMAARLGTDLNSATIQIGKALNDPIKGVTALGRAGVQFTEQQKEQIAALVESGDQLGAQKIILEELEVQFGGSAKAAGETMGGQLNKLRFALEDTAASILATLMPALKVIAAVLKRVADFFGALPKPIKTVVGVLAILAVAAGPVIRAFRGIGVAMMFLMANPVVAVAAGIAALAILIITNWDKVKRITSAVFGWIGGFLRSIWNGIAGSIGRVLSGLRSAFSSAFNAIRSIVQGVATAILAIIDRIIGAIEWAYDRLQSLKGLVQGGGISDAVAEIRDAVTPRPRAMGGPVMAGRDYLIGERGPEIFRPRVSGAVIPNHRINGGTTIQVFVQNAYGADDLATTVERALRRKNIRVGA